jgi:energy-coupling factor transporter transmembrane protein EcfT
MVLMFIFDPITPLVLYLLALGAVAVTARIPLRAFALAHIPFLAFGLGLGLVVVNALSRGGDVLWQAGVLRVTTEGLLVGAALALRTLVIGVLSIRFVLSTDGVALMTSLHQHARLGSRLTYAVLAGYRMLEELYRASGRPSARRMRCALPCDPMASHRAAFVNTAARPSPCWCCRFARASGWPNPSSRVASA